MIIDILQYKSKLFSYNSMNLVIQYVSKDYPLFNRNLSEYTSVGHYLKAKKKNMCVSGFIPRKNRVGRSDLIFIFS